MRLFTRRFRQELQISCGNMSWVLSSATQRLFAGSKFWAEPQDGTDASAAVEIEQYEGDGAEDTDIAVSTLVIDTHPTLNSWKRLWHLHVATPGKDFVQISGRNVCCSLPAVRARAD